MLDPNQLSVAFNHLEQEGYCVVPDVLDAGGIARIRGALDEAAARDLAGGGAWFSHGNHRLFMLLNQAPEFLDLIGDETALALASHLLGDQRLLSSFTANIAMPGNQPQPLHTDQGYIPDPWLRVEAVNVIWVIDEFTAENGATRVVPRSHLIGANPPEAGIFTVPIVARSGSMVCLDGRVWHGTGTNLTTSGARRALFAYYCRPYIRQQENSVRSLKLEERRRLTPLQRQLLGFDIWLGLGAVDGLPPEWMDGRVRIGPGRPDVLDATR